MTQKASHRVARRMIHRLEEREKIQVDHQKFARLALDGSLAHKQVWNVAGGPQIKVDERYSINFLRAMNTPSEGLHFRLEIRSFPDDAIHGAKALARSGRDVARKLSREGIAIRHQSEFGSSTDGVVNTFDFVVLAHHSNYKVLVQPYLRTILKPYIQASACRDLRLSVTHPQIDDYARFVLKSQTVREPSQPSPHF